MPIVKQNQASCIDHWKGQCWGCRGASEGLVEVVRHWNIVFVRYSPDGPYAQNREMLRKTSCQCKVGLRSCLMFLDLIILWKGELLLARVD